MYLLIHSATWHFIEKDNNKYFITDSTDKYLQVYFRIRFEIRATNGGKELSNEKNYSKLILMMICLWISH